MSTPKLRSLNPLTSDYASNQIDSTVKYASVVEIVAHLESVNCSLFDSYTTKFHNQLTPLQTISVNNKTKDTLLDASDLDGFTMDDFDILVEVSNNDYVKSGIYKLFINNRSVFITNKVNYKQLGFTTSFNK